MDLLWIVLIASGILLSLSVTYRIFPPKRKNWFYGYWIPRGANGDVVWKAANGFFANLLIASVLSSLVLSVFSFYYVPDFVLLIWGALLVLFIVFSTFLTERFLKNRFDRRGNPRRRSIK